MTQRELLVLGGAGQVGIEVIAAAGRHGFTVTAPGRDTVDLADAASVEALVASRPWAAVINAAAYTAVDKAESDVAAAWRANALGPAILAAATAKAGIPIIHVSTDYVFDGAAPRPYEVDDPVGPLGVYGASKEGGEQAVRTANPRHVIVRTAWVVSPHRGNFVKTMLRLAAERPELRVVADQHGCPTHARDLAEALLAIARRQADDTAAPTGTYHFTNAGETTWHGFAQAIVAEAARHDGPQPTVTPIATADYPTPARRPANSRLSLARIAADYGIRPRPWQDATADLVGELKRT